jgi:plasmid maintenance system antidote protein VapI
LYIKEKKSQKEIAEKLKLEPYDIQNALVKYGMSRKNYKGGIVPKNHLKHWTKEQDEFLLNNIGILGYEAIASSQIIQKKATSVKCRVRDLKLGDALLHADFITKTYLARTLEIDVKVVSRWIENHGLRSVKKVVALEKVVASINLDDFWKWAEQNKNLINWKKFKEGDLGAEPDWTLKAREDYRKNTPKNCNKEWSNEEDALLQSYYKLGKTYKEMAELMGRSQQSVSRR